MHVSGLILFFLRINETGFVNYRKSVFTFGIGEII